MMLFKSTAAGSIHGKKCVHCGASASVAVQPQPTGYVIPAPVALLCDGCLGFAETLMADAGVVFRDVQAEQCDWQRSRDKRADSAASEAAKLGLRPRYTRKASFAAWMEAYDPANPAHLALVRGV